MAFAPIEIVQRIVDQRGKANALLMAGREAAGELPPAGAEKELSKQLRPQLVDYGIKAEHVRLGGKTAGDRKVGDVSYINLTTDRMLFED